MLTRKGSEILSDLYRDFREHFIEEHEGCNENDVEQGFLREIAVLVHGDLRQDISDRIDLIR